MSDFELYYSMLEVHPYLFGLSQVENLEAVGVNRVRRMPGFDYRGTGILIGFVDTGIDYTHSVFRRIQVLTDSAISSDISRPVFWVLAS